MKKATMRLPLKLKTKRCWVGCYGGHFDVVVVFSKKPKKAKEGEYNEGEYCRRLNKEIEVGVFDKWEFNQWFGTDIQPDNTRLEKVELYHLTAVWWEGRILGLDTNYD